MQDAALSRLKAACETSNHRIGVRAAQIFRTIQEEAPGLVTMEQKQRYTPKGEPTRDRHQK